MPFRDYTPTLRPTPALADRGACTLTFSKEMKQAWIILASPVALILLAMAAWIGCEVYHARSSNGNGIATYADYRTSLPTPRAARQLKKDGTEYFAFFGPVSAPLALTSGSPAYIFDAKGRLVDWTLDTGGDPRFSSAWSAHQGPEIDMAEFQRLLTRNKTAEQVSVGNGEQRH